MREALITRLRGSYTPKAVEGPHDWTHPFRMVQIGKKLEGILDFDTDELELSIWLHNLDRMQDKGDLSRHGGLGGLARAILQTQTHCTGTALDRIVNAVAKHGKLEADGDSGLLHALRSCDRIDWLGPMGIVGVAQFWTINGFYGNPNPFDPSPDQKHRHFLDDALRQTEWYAMLSSDEVRAIADPWMPARLHFLRAFAAEAAQRHSVENVIEERLQMALGEHYDAWRP